MGPGVNHLDPCSVLCDLNHACSETQLGSGIDSMNGLQVQLQQISQQLNEQVAQYLDKGFEIKDVSSGMTKGSGELSALHFPSKHVFAILT